MSACVSAGCSVFFFDQTHPFGYAPEQYVFAMISGENNTDLVLPTCSNSNSNSVLTSQRWLLHRLLVDHSVPSCILSSDIVSSKADLCVCVWWLGGFLPSQNAAPRMHAHRGLTQRARIEGSHRGLALVFFTLQDPGRDGSHISGSGSGSRSGSGDPQAAFGSDYRFTGGRGC